MEDFALLRRKMVERQLAARGISDSRLLQVMGETPRHLFVSESLAREAYDDNPLPIGEGQTISQPYMVAIMTQLLEPTPDDKVLEIGTGSGYQAAILSRLAKWVYTVERRQSLSERASRIIKGLGYDNVSFLVGDGSGGWPSQAPFDGIIVTAGGPRVPDALVDQLAMNGRLIIPVGDRFSQVLKRVWKTSTGIKAESHTGCRFVDLVGEHAWPGRDAF